MNVSDAVLIAAITGCVNVLLALIAALKAHQAAKLAASIGRKTHAMLKQCLDLHEEANGKTQPKSDLSKERAP